MSAGNATKKKTATKKKVAKPSGDPEFATLDSLRELTDQTKEIELEGVGRFLIRKISVREFLDMQEAAIGEDGEVDEWEGTKLLIQTSVVTPDLSEDEDLLGALPISVTKELTKAIAEFAGTDDNFTEGSPTE